MVEGQESGSDVEALGLPWPWYIAGPIIGLFVPVLLLLENRELGISGNFRHLCAAIAPGRVEFFRYDWKRTGGWNLSFLAGIVVGGFVAMRLIGVPDIALASGTKSALLARGLRDFSGLVPRDLFAWPALLTVKGLVSVVIGGFLVGFGSAYAGGCTSGHAIFGLATLQRSSLLAVVGFFVGGLAATHWLLPLLI